MSDIFRLVSKDAEQRLRQAASDLGLDIDKDLSAIIEKADKDRYSEWVLEMVAQFPDMYRLKGETVDAKA